MGTWDTEEEAAKYLLRTYGVRAKKLVLNDRMGSAIAAYESAANEASDHGYKELAKVYMQEVKRVENIVKRVNRLDMGASSSSSSSAQAVSASGNVAQQGDDGGKGLVNPLKIEPTDVTFKTIAGMEQQKNDLRVNFIWPIEFPKLMGGNRNLLMYGPPGNGKTLLAKAVVSEFRNSTTKNTFITVASGSTVRDMWSGNTEKNIKRYFEVAQQWAEETRDPRARTIIFWDEFDALAGKRTTESMSSSVNELLGALDGLKNYDKVIVIAATNLPWNLDSAILRRFGSKVFVDLPTGKGRLKLIQDTILQRLRMGKPTVNKLSDKMKELVLKISDITGPTKDGSKKALQFLEKKDFEGSDSAVHTMGYSYSDIRNAIERGLNYVAQTLLNTYNAFKDFNLRGKVSESKSTERSKVYMTEEQILSNRDTLLQAIREYRVSVDVNEYEELLCYTKKGYLCKLELELNKEHGSNE